VKPYVGARVGLNRFSYDDDYRRAGYHATETFRKTKTGLGVMTGVGYDITQNVALDAGYRYNHWGNFDGLKVHTHEVSAGVRVKY
ncbi:opacity family porin, partial [Neisseria elongata]|uniref:opacity family porin n=1 Tax=Neisseria elongata TaxID=495 RepID=UPI0028ED5D29